MKKTILITGGNGNIAKMLNKNLSSKYIITSLTRNDFDLLNFGSINDYLFDKEFDVLIHTAINGGRRTKEENGEIFYRNLIMFENLIKFSSKFKLIINLDSGAIYDRTTDIFERKEEELKTVPSDYYGFSKYLIFKRSISYENVVNLRIFNIFHENEESDRFIKTCYLSKKNRTNVKINQDKFFDFMYEDDFIKIVEYYIENFSNKLPKTINLSYISKYKLSDIAELILGDKSHILIEDKLCNKNYCGNGSLLNELNLNLDGLETSLKKYESRILL